jgi:hypothetical protein
MDSPAGVHGHGCGLEGAIHLACPLPLGLFGKWRIEVDGRGLKGILGNFEL